MSRICSPFFILLIVGLAQCFSAKAGEVRAHWTNASQIVFRLSPGTFASATTQFVLIDGNFAIKAVPPLPLRLITLSENWAVLDTSALSPVDLQKWISQSLRVALVTQTQHILDSSPLEYSGLLDQLFYYDGPDLGGSCSASSCSLKLWAPTAQKVRLFIYRSGSPPESPAQILNMQLGSAGVWGQTLPIEFKNNYYLYEVQVYQPRTNQIETHLVSDPYSKSLSLNGRRSQLVDENDEALLPDGWRTLQKPRLNSFNEATIYELHLRDFSATDQTVPADLRGTYLAFTQTQSAGMRHLKSLAIAGLTHLHLMPFNDFGSVDEDKTQWSTDAEVHSDLQEPQSILSVLRGSDSYNWGYDPVHFLAPDGSYAREAEGGQRLLEVRHMVKAVNEAGLRLVQDVAFNHTYENAAAASSVFDKIVPLYYYRLDDQGQPFTTSCCYDTASEKRMMEKLMIDAVVHWARAYKIDGFRFDLMSFHSRSTMERLRQRLRALNIANDGVDGTRLLLYGEGWGFGSLFNQSPQESMHLENSFGTNYGFFNDRLRDAVRGGTTNSTEKSDQGFATGLYFDFNHEPANRNTPPDEAGQREKLLHLGDVIKAGLAGNLRDFEFTEHRGFKIKAGDLRFRGAQVAVASQALETLNYVSAHDGYTLWDAIQAKAPFHAPGRSPDLASSADRQRQQQLALAIPLLGQGVPFLEAGSELLRSKNGDQDSYDSGDFFNRIDWLGTTNFWGQGLPPFWKNGQDWSFWEPRLRDPGMQVTPELIHKTSLYVKALLQLRKSSNLFHLNSLEEITSTLSFIDGESAPEPGLIAMLLQSPQESLLVFFNASPALRTFRHEVLKKPWTLHPLLDEQVDESLSLVTVNSNEGKIQLPGRSTVILKLRSPGASR